MVQSMNQPVPRVVRICLADELDIFGKERLAALLVPAEEADIAILDLTDTTYLDASALGCLVYLRNQVRKRGAGVVHLIGVRPNVLRTFSVTGLDKVFLINQAPVVPEQPPLESQRIPFAS